MARLHSPPWNGRKKPWRACVKLGGVEYYLGSYASQAEAEARESEFRREMGVDA